MVQNWNQLYSPGKNLALDETTVGFKGNSEFIQYNKSKPTTYRIKLFSLADSTTSFMGIVETIVNELLDNYKNSNHTILMDSYYSSPVLFTPSL